MQNAAALDHARTCRIASCEHAGCLQYVWLFQLEHAIMCTTLQCKQEELCENIKANLSQVMDCFKGTCAKRDSCVECGVFISCADMHNSYCQNSSCMFPLCKQRSSTASRIGADYQVAELPSCNPKPFINNQDIILSKPQVEISSSKLEQARIEQVRLGSIVLVLFRSNYLWVSIVKLLPQQRVEVLPFDTVLLNTHLLSRFTFVIHTDSILLWDELKERALLNTPNLVGPTSLQLHMFNYPLLRNEYVTFLRGNNSNKNRANFVQMELCLPRQLGVAKSPNATCLVCDSVGPTLKSCAQFHVCQVIMCNSCIHSTDIENNEYWFCASCASTQPLSAAAAAPTAGKGDSLIDILKQHNLGSISNQDAYTRVKQALRQSAEQHMTLI